MKAIGDQTFIEKQKENRKLKRKKLTSLDVLLFYAVQ